MNNILHDVLSLGMAHVEVIRKQLQDINLTADDAEDSDRHKRAQFLIAAASAILDIIHPAFGVAYDIFPDDNIHKMLDYYKILHSKHPARDAKMECPCVMCKGVEVEMEMVDEQR